MICERLINHFKDAAPDNSMLLMILTESTNVFCRSQIGLGFTWCHVFGDIKGVRGAGELGRVVVDVLDGDVQPHVGRLLPVVSAHQEGILRPAFPIQFLGGDQIPGLRVDPEALVRPTDDGVGHKSVGTLR